MNKDFRKELVPRGFLYPYILMLLSKKPMNGYTLIKKIKEHTGFWHPSTGSIYPALSYLKSNGYVKISKKTEKSTTYAITKKGMKSASKFMQTKKEIKKKFAEMFSELFNVDKAKIAVILEDFEKDFKTKSKRASQLIGHLAEMRELIFEISKTPSKISKAKIILTDSNSKLRKLTE